MARQTQRQKLRAPTEGSADIRRLLVVMLRAKVSSFPNPRFWLGAVLLTGFGIEFAGAAITRPFTWPAGLVVAIAIVFLLATVMVQRGARRVPRVLARRPSELGAEANHRWGQRWLLWIGPLGGVTIWELFCYAASPRNAHPTISSLLDSWDVHAAGRATAFVAWIALGFYLVTR